LFTFAEGTFMRVYTDISTLPAFKAPVITIGSFDGLHRGHQAILNQVKNLAKETGGESIIITFDPHPRQVIYPKAGDLSLITTLEEKIWLMEQFEVDNLVVVPFTVEFAQLSADEYIEKFLIERFRPKYIVIGYDHRFGLNRQGDIHFLKWYSHKANYEVIELDEQVVDNITISSSKIRKALEKSDLKTATGLLNHPFILIGKVVKGIRLGTSIGYPTANISYQNKIKLIPPDGIYAAYVHHNSTIYKGVLYIGVKPTVTEDNKRVIEVHIIDFSQDIYDEEVIIEFIEFIREDMKFDSIEAMRSQIAMDKDAALEILNKIGNTFQTKSETIL
jgi:riboflavin kinase/FMN adenylyltransferase